MGRKRYFFWLTLVFFLAADQFTKVAVLKNLAERQSVPVVENILHLTLVKNSGIAFGFLQGSNQILLGVLAICLVIGVVFLYIHKNTSTAPVNVAYGLVCAGALGNLLDRVVYGQVIDFIDFRVWPVFNVADTVIVLGLVSLFLFYTLRHEKLPESNYRKL